MIVVMGATGHVGGAVARALREAGREVLVVTRDAAKVDLPGAQVAQLDVHDTPALRDAFQRGRRAFLLNPPAPPSTDIDREERATVRAILSALEGSGLEFVVAASTYGAQPGAQTGDLGSLYELEQGLAGQSIPHAIARGAYYFTNFDRLLEPAREQGVLPTLIPPDLCLPMVAPADIGRLSAQLLLEPNIAPRLVHVEGPLRHTFADVAEAFSRALQRDVKASSTPREEWEQAFRALGFCEPAARSFAGMTDLVVRGPELPDAPIRGGTTLQAYIDALVAQAS